MAWLIQNPIGMPFSRAGEFKEWCPGDGSRDAFAKVARSISRGQSEVESKECPKELILEGTRKIVGFFKSENGFWIVSEEIREFILKLDGEIHQFFPITIRGLNGDPFDGSWFLLNVFVCQSSIIDERSDVRPMSSHEETRAHMGVLQTGKSVSLDATKLDPAINIWREHRYGRVLLLSDALAAWLDERGSLPRSRGTITTIPAHEV